MSQLASNSSAMMAALVAIGLQTFRLLLPFLILLAAYGLL
jgi:hypothetical protein